MYLVGLVTIKAQKHPLVAYFCKCMSLFERAIEFDIRFTIDIATFSENFNCANSISG